MLLIYFLNKVQKVDLKLKIFCLTIIFGGIFGVVEKTFGATINAASCSYTDVATAYNSASAGDIIVLPAGGSCTWSSALTISKAVTISGNGTTLTRGAVMTYGFFRFSNNTFAALTRITGFTFQLTNTSGGAALFFDVGCNVQQFRFDHNTVYHGVGIGEITGSKGVVDHNTIYNSHNMFVFYGGTRAQADASWDSMSAGTANALFVEDNTVIIDSNWTGTNGNDTIFDTNNGGKLVFRHNTVNMNNAPSGQTFWMLMTHGNACFGDVPQYWEANSDCRRGQSVVEIYDNTFSGHYHPAWFVIRGSANLVHDNVLNCDVGTPYVYMREEEAYLPSDYGDTNRTAWPGSDQVHNSFFWNNTNNGSADSDESVTVEPESATFIQKNRDYFLHAPCASGDSVDAYGHACTHGRETFTGPNGASGSDPTDGNPYNNIGTMQFTAGVDNVYLGYVPYTYPHPLQGEADITPPTVPQGLSVE